MSILFSGGESRKDSEWEPEPYELPLIVPANVNPSRKPLHVDEDEDEAPKSRVIVIDLA
jgi:hypothetical protein